MKKKIPEKVILKAVIDYFNFVYSQYCSVYCFRAGSGSMITSSGYYFKTGRVGLPDIVCCIDGKFIGVEIKTLSGKQTPKQKKAQNDILEAGGKYYLIRSLDEIKKIFPC